MIPITGSYPQKMHTNSWPVERGRFLARDHDDLWDMP